MHRQFTRTLLLLSFLGPSAPGGLVVTDFNGLEEAPLATNTLNEGQGGGLGFLDGDTWNNTETLNVLAGDLAPPASTNYDIEQAPITGAIQGTFDDARQATRAFAEPLVGTVWFSFLLNQPNAGARGGITFNQNSPIPRNPRVVATGTEVRLGLGDLLQTEGEGAHLPSLGETALLLGRLTIDASGGEESLDLWINPSLTPDPNDLPPPEVSLISEEPLLDSGVERVGLQSFAPNRQGGIIDMLRLSDSETAFLDVTTDIVITPDDPHLFTVIPNPFEGTTYRVTDAPAIAEITLQNTGETNSLTISETSISGTDAAFYTVRSRLPLVIPPGQSDILQVQIDPAGEPRATEATLTLVSDDPSNPRLSVSLNSQLISANRNLLGNGDFEESDAPPAGWTSTGVTLTEGISPSSHTAALLAANANLKQAVAGEAQWFLDCFFQSPETPGRAFNLRVNTSLGNLNLRYQGTTPDSEQSWNAFDNVKNFDFWGEALALPAILPGATYRLRIIGNNWDGTDPSYDLHLSKPNSRTTDGILTGLRRFQNAVPSQAPNEIELTAEFGDSPGYLVDDILFANGSPAPPAPEFTSFAHDPLAGTTTLGFPSNPGTEYLIESSPDLLTWQVISNYFAQTNLARFTLTDESDRVQFYRIRTIP